MESAAPPKDLLHVFEIIRKHVLIYSREDLKNDRNIQSYLAVAGIVNGDFPLIDAFEASRGIRIFNSQNPGKELEFSGTNSCMQLAYNLDRDRKTIAISISCDVLMSDENMTPEGKLCWARLPDSEKLKCSGAASHLVIDCYTPGLEWNFKSSHLINGKVVEDAAIYASKLLI